jgi:hypothetical protein
VFGSIGSFPGLWRPYLCDIVAEYPRSPFTTQFYLLTQDLPTVLIAPEHLDAATNFVFSTMAEVEEPYVEPAYEEEAAEPEYVAEEEEFVAEGVATEVKLFGKWAFGDIEVRDISLVVSTSNSFLILNKAAWSHHSSSSISSLFMFPGLHCLQG